jgi:large subunit ribosomal protein L15e
MWKSGSFSVMQTYAQIGKQWRSLTKSSSAVYKERAIAWRRGPTVVRLEHPTRLDRARALGYKAKQGFVVVRIKITRGGMRQKRPTSGRRPKHLGTVKIKGHFSSQDTAERRVLEKYPNSRLIGSYPVYQDGRYIWFEVIAVDLGSPSVQNSYELRRRFPEIKEMAA